jgi:hypothetical protein
MWPYNEAEQHWLGDYRTTPADAVPEIVERYGLRRTYLLADAWADAIFRMVAMFGRWPSGRAPAHSERDTAGLA